MISDDTSTRSSLEIEHGRVLVFDSQTGARYEYRGRDRLLRAMEKQSQINDKGATS